MTGKKAEATQEVINKTLTSTALAYAFMYVSHSASPEEVAARQRASSMQLRGQRALGRWSLDDLVKLFRIMIGRENIFTPKLWLERGRLWRLILLQVDGHYWGCFVPSLVCIACRSFIS